MLVRMSEAIGRLVLRPGHGSFVWLHACIHQLTMVLRDLHKGRYVGTMVNTSNTGANGTISLAENHWSLVMALVSVTH